MSHLSHLVEVLTLVESNTCNLRKSSTAVFEKKMQPSSLLICTLLVCIFVITSAGPVGPPPGSGRLLGKHTFQAPFLFGTITSIPFWNYGGSTVATENFIRIVPAIRSRNGWIWNTEPVTAKEWEVTLEFNIHNTHSPGADGMAFWYAKTPNKVGSLFGYMENFDGLGIIFDTYDNNGNGDNPSVIAVRNYGQNTAWDYDHDLISNQMDRCRADFRNPLGGNTKARIVYQKNSLHVFMDTHGTNQFALCMTVNNVELPSGYYFGVTAATGGLADYHDVYSLVARDLAPESDQPASQPTRAGRRGWYDPYKQGETGAATEEAAPSPAGVNAAEEEFLSSLKERLKKYGIDDTAGNKPAEPEPAQPATEAPAQTQAAEDNSQKEQVPLKKRIPLKPRVARQDPAPPVVPPNTQAQQQHTPAPAAAGTQQAAVQVQFPEDYMKQETGSLILQTLEVIDKQLKDAASKNDITAMLTRVQTMDEKQATVQNNLSQLRDHIKNEVTSMTDGLKRETQSLADEIKRLDSMLNTLYLQVDSIQNTQGRFVKDFERSSDEVKQTIKKESSFGFWTFFILFQLVFTGLLIYWKKYRDQSQKGRYLD